MSGSKDHGEFHFENTQINNFVNKPDGPVTIQNLNENFESGASKKSVEISDGNFPQANFFGSASYNNNKSNITGGDGVHGIDDWSYDVEGAILTILKANISTEQLLAALLEGKKIKSLYDYVLKCRELECDVVFDSFINTNDDEDS